MCTPATACQNKTTLTHWIIQKKAKLKRSNKNKEIFWLRKTVPCHLSLFKAIMETENLALTALTVEKHQKTKTQINIKKMSAKKLLRGAKSNKLEVRLTKGELKHIWKQSKEGEREWEDNAKTVPKSRYWLTSKNKTKKPCCSLSEGFGSKRDFGQLKCSLEGRFRGQRTHTQQKREGVKL